MGESSRANSKTTTTTRSSSSPSETPRRGDSAGATKCTCDLEILPRALSNVFAAYGRLLVRWPWLFIIAPLVLTGILLPGVFRMPPERDVFKQWSPDNSRAMADMGRLSAIEQRYPTFCNKQRRLGNSSSFDDFICPETADLLGGVKMCNFTSVIYVAKPGVNLWDKTVFDQMFNLEETVAYRLKVRVSDEKGYVGMSDVCMKSPKTGRCMIASLTQADKTVKDAYQDGFIPPTYPYFVYRWIGDLLAGVTTENDEFNGVITNITAMMSFWCYDQEADIESVQAFDNEMMTMVEDQTAPWVPDLDVWQYSLFKGEATNMAEFTRITPIYIGAGIAIVLLTMVMTTTDHPATSKPWLGLVGLFSTILAIGAAFGFMGWIGKPWIQLTAMAPFLTLGIGLDDMFVLLAGWNAAPPNLSSDERIVWTMRKSGTSVSITTFINVIAFIIGSYTPFPALQVFSAFSATSIAMDFVYQLTFYMGVMVYFGRMEEQGRHALCLGKTLEDRDEILNAKNPPSVPYIMCCTTDFIGVKGERKLSTKKNSQSQRFFRKFYCPVLFSKGGRIVVLVSLAVYLSLSVVYMTKMNIGLREKTTNVPVPNRLDVFDIIRSVFRANYAYRVTVGFESSNIDYFNTTTQKSLDTVFQELERSELFADSNATSWWLRSYLKYAKQENFTIKTQQQFTLHLVRDFLWSMEGNVYSQDIRFTRDGWKIAYSRGIVAAIECRDTDCDSAILTLCRETAKKFSEQWDIIIHNLYFPFFEQYMITLWLTIYNCLICLGAVLFASFIMLPNFSAMFYLTFCICSILAGIFGCFYGLDINLDGLSMVSILIAIGYCVDFVTHYTHGYMHSRAATRKEKATDAMCELGFAVFQAGASTVVIMLPLGISRSYMLSTYFYCMFLCVIFSAYHSMLVLPVILSFFGPLTRTEDMNVVDQYVTKATLKLPDLIVDIETNKRQDTLKKRPADLKPVVASHEEFNPDLYPEWSLQKVQDPSLFEWGFKKAKLMRRMQSAERADCAECEERKERERVAWKEKLKRRAALNSTQAQPAYPGAIALRQQITESPSGSTRSRSHQRRSRAPDAEFSSLPRKHHSGGGHHHHHDVSGEGLYELHSPMTLRREDHRHQHYHDHSPANLGREYDAEESFQNYSRDEYDLSPGRVNILQVNSDSDDSNLTSVSQQGERTERRRANTAGAQELRVHVNPRVRELVTNGRRADATTSDGEGSLRKERQYKKNKKHNHR